MSFIWFEEKNTKDMNFYITNYFLTLNVLIKKYPCQSLTHKTLYITDMLLDRWTWVTIATIKLST